MQNSVYSGRPVWVIHSAGMQSVVTESSIDKVRLTYATVHGFEERFYRRVDMDVPYLLTNNDKFACFEPDMARAWAANDNATLAQDLEAEKGE